MQRLRVNVAEDRSAEHEVLSQARHEAKTLDKALSACVHPAGAAAAAGGFAATTATSGATLFGITDGSRISNGFGDSGGGGGDVSAIGSGTVGLDYPRPSSVSTATHRTEAAAGNAGGGLGGGCLAGGGAGPGEPALRRVRELFAALETVGNGNDDGACAAVMMGKTGSANVRRVVGVGDEGNRRRKGFVGGKEAAPGAEGAMTTVGFADADAVVVTAGVVPMAPVVAGKAGGQPLVRLDPCVQLQVRVAVVTGIRGRTLMLHRFVALFVFLSIHTLAAETTGLRGLHCLSPPWWKKFVVFCFSCCARSAWLVVCFITPNNGASLTMQL